MSQIVKTIECSRLENADAATLRRLWTEVKGSEPPKTFTARLMRLALAWDAQAARKSREPAKTKRAWNRIILARSGQCATNSGNGDLTNAAYDGTRILKDWGGITHEVLVTKDGGAAWNGQDYSSLSAMARAMTGTNRNGPKFFGLREGDKI